VNSPEGVSAFLEPEHRALATRLQEYVQSKIAPLASPHDDEAARNQARALLAELGGAGWLKHLLPSGDSRSLCLIREALAAYSPLADSTFAVQGLGLRPLALEGHNELIGDAVAGRLMGAFAMTEPEAGSDVGSIATRAVAGGDGGYRLTGHKTLISNAGLADFYVVFATLHPEAGSRGIGAFLVHRSEPGLIFSGPQVLSAPHPLGSLEFRDCAATLVSLQGFKLGMRTLDALRVSVAAAACGMAGRAFAEARSYALQRRQFGKSLSEFQLVQEKLAVMATELDASRLLTYRAAWEKDQGELRNSRSVAMAKAYSTEAAQRIIDQAMQILGGQGMLAQHPVEHLYRAVRALRIYEGTTEIQHLIIAKDLLSA
jgi:acyl-CoA dehydrogenase